MNQIEDQSLHRLVIINRGQANLDGVLNVDSYDAREIVLDTELGMMALRGEDLNIKQLNLEDGQLFVEGIIKGVDYLDNGLVNGKGRKSLLSRLLG